MSRPPLLVGLALAAVRLIAVVVPRRDRDSWRREWEGEILHRHVTAGRAADGRLGLHLSLIGRSFGSVADAAWLRRQFTADSEIVHDARHAVRLYRRSPGMLSLVVGVLAVGIGAATAVCGAVELVFLKPLPYPDAERIVTVWQHTGQADREDVAPANFLDWRDRSTELDIVAAAEPFSRDFTSDAEPEIFSGARVTERFFDTFGTTLTRGRLFNADDYRLRRNVVVISDALWKRRFGRAPDLVGRPIRLDDEPFEVIGILPADFEPRVLGGRVDVWTPKVAIEDYERRSRGGGYWNVVATLRPGRTLAQAQADLDVISAQLARENPRTNTGLRGVAVPLRTHLAGGTERTFLLLGFGSGFILLLAFGSVANLQLGLLAGRLKEFAVRAALGAHRARLARQVLVEGFAIAILAVVGGVPISSLMFSAIRAVGPDILTTPAGGWPSVPALVFASGFGVLAATMAAVIPVLTILRGGTVTAAGGSLSTRSVAPALYGRSVLVVVQVALALVLLVSAGLLGRSLVRLLGVDPGLATEHLLALQVFAYDRNETAAKRSAFFAETLDRIRALPGVEGAGAASTVPFLKADIDIGSAMLIQGSPPRAAEDAPRVFLASATPDYFRAAGIPLRRGRFFTADDTMGARGIAIVNTTVARRHWPDADPLGRVIEVVDSGRKKTLEIVGVVGDLRYGGLQGATRPEVFLPHAQSPSAAMTYVVRTAADAASMTTAVKRAVWSVDPLQTFYDTGAVSDMIQTSLRPRVFVLRLVLIFALIGLVVAVVGAYGAVAWALRRRTAEFGVRMALGASASDIRRLILGYAGRLALAGIAIGLAASLMLGRLLDAFLFEVDTADPLTLLSVSAVLLAAVLLASAPPARRAARINPAGALRA
jgi:putative ABC transport system permease protein